MQRDWPSSILDHQQKNSQDSQNLCWLGQKILTPAHFYGFGVFQISRCTSGGDDDISWSEKYHAPGSAFYGGNGHSSWEAVSSSHKPLQDTVSTTLDTVSTT